MAYLDSTGLTTLWNKIKSTFGAALDIVTASTTVDIKLENKASTPSALDTITIPAATDSKAGVMTAAEHTKLSGVAENANNYVHPTTAGNKHIPAGGSSGQILGYDGAGTAKWMDAPETGVSKIVAGNNVSISPSGGTGEVTVNATDTTYESKAAASGGSAVSLCTTGEKYTWNGKYTKPSGGIPGTDLANSYYLASNPNGYTDDTVANSKYTKPAGGIPAGDLAESYYKASNPSGYQNASQVQALIDASAVGAAKYQGTLASEAELTALTNFKQGWYYIASAGWTSASLGITVETGNMLIANADGSTYSASKFNVIQADIEAIPDSVINALN